MLLCYKNLITILLGLHTYLQLATAAYTPAACSVPNNGIVGATVRYFQYPIHDTWSYRESWFLEGGYLENKYVGTVTGVLNLT